MTDPQMFITHMTNLVYLSTITQVLHSTAFEEAQNETAQPLNQAMGSFTSADVKEGWELTCESITTAVREIQAQAYEQAVDTAYEHYLTEEQRDHLHTLNPYKETN
ncbi:hypothetical protein [Rothia nasimurium]|uniref:hypothetical protein n=1 Tax=Rothia nasimurium TaxID=85336 RepID=UPI001F1A6BD1|nr:hypothetical protein [Rothia nasimurium]